MFHGLQAIAKFEQLAAATAAVEAIAWPQYSGNLVDYPALVKKWKSARQKCCAQAEDDQLCEFFQEKCMLPVITRRLVTSSV